MSGEAKKLFIIHAHRDDAALQDLKRLLTRNGYTLRDSFIDSATSNEATTEQHVQSNILAPSISWADAVVVLIYPGAHTRPGVNWEIEYAQQQGKRIVGLYVQGGTESDLPASFQLYGDALVDWLENRVLGAIAGRIDTLLMPDGKTELPERDIDRFDCGEAEPE